MNRISITRPDDWHLHLRDGEIMKAVLPATYRVYGRAMVMPNLIPPVTSSSAATRYKSEILASIPDRYNFQPQMTCYLTDTTSPDELIDGYKNEIFIAAKLYPAGATTNSDNGVTSVRNIYQIFEKMQKAGMPLSVHGEVTDPDVDIFDREKVFIDKILKPVRRDFPELKIVFEHVSSKEGVDYILDCNSYTSSTITPHHLILTRNDIFKDGLRMYNYCLPVVKTKNDRKALISAACSGDSRFFLGTDSAPHLSSNKLKDKAAAGIFSAPNSIEYITQIFDENLKLENLEKFSSLNGAKFYGRMPNSDKIVLKKNEKTLEKDLSIQLGKDNIHAFKPDVLLYWQVEDDD